MRARLTPDGDGFRLNAYKNYVTGGHKARACLVWCRFPESAGTKGIGAVVVEGRRRQANRSRRREGDAGQQRCPHLIQYLNLSEDRPDGSVWSHSRTGPYVSRRTA